jgi:hypothetical protein
MTGEEAPERWRQAPADLLFLLPEGEGGHR